MAPAVKRRVTPVASAKQFLSAITTIRQQKQIPNFERISRYMQRYSDITEEEVKDYLNYAVFDGFIEEYTAVVVKGQHTGIEQEGYRILPPDEGEQKHDGHDWYCFECHAPGEVYECSCCFRVYHKRCTREDTRDTVFTCTICRAGRQKNRMKKKMLNTLLNYTISRLREKTRDLYNFSSKVGDDDFQRFVYKKMDLNDMVEKVQASQYRCVDEFHADAQLIVHNCALIYGEDRGTLTELAIIMAIDSKRELDEIDRCPECYYRSNAKPDGWFSELCDPPHELVYAKQTGYAYWPAKVVEELDGRYDVRFFGGWHTRAVIPAMCIKPISTDLKKLKIKKTVAFQKAIAELQEYQNKLKEWEKTGAKSRATESEEDSEHLSQTGTSVEVSVDGEHLSQTGTSVEVSEEEHEADKEEDETPSEVERRKSNKKQHKKSKAKRKDSKIESRKTEKRKQDTSIEERAELEDEIANRQVTSTSVEKQASKRSRNFFHNNYPDETSTVTSTVDKITNTLQKASSTSTQTDSAPPVQESQHLLSEQIWEDRMVKALSHLTKRLEDKFEEEKKFALEELQQQLQEDFGKDKQQAVERTLASMKLEVEKARKAGEDRAREQYMEEMKKLAAKHKEAISQVKKKQWCQFCEAEAMYHCCWNTSYCSVKCQQEHWHQDHKRVCRRKRA